MMSIVSRKGMPPYAGHAFRITGITVGITVLVLLLASAGAVRAEAGLPDALQMPGRLEASGTHFELHNSNYLNVALDSSSPIGLVLESVPETVTMQISSASDAASTQITLRGLAPGTTYYKYEDDYHHRTTFTTDASGEYTYTQDLAVPHLVTIQTRPSTRFIRNDPTGGNCTSIGNWNPTTRTCTLTADLTETIQIDSDGVTLDGNGHTIKGNNTGYGVYLLHRTGVTIKNLNIKNFTSGIYLIYSDSNNLTGNSASNNGIGIHLDQLNGLGSNYNNLTGNSASNNSYGFYIVLSGGNNLTDNSARSNNESGIVISYHRYGITTLTNNTAVANNVAGIVIDMSYLNTLTNNIVSSNTYGILLSGSYGGYGSYNNILTNNIVRSNTYGIYLSAPNRNNTLTNNDVSSNSYGIYITTGDSFTSQDNHIYNNYFSNSVNAYDSGNNTWNTTRTRGMNIVGGPWLGGNYWSDYAGTDTNGDGIGESQLPYSSSGRIIYGGDYLPLIALQLNVSVSELPDPVASGGTSQVTVHVTSGGSPVSGADVSISATGGTLDPISGTTDANGDFKPTYMAPAVTANTEYIISATASKADYTGGSGSNPIVVTPHDVLAYYRGLGSNPDAVETTDLLKAVDDRNRNIVPPGFISPITTQQLLVLADEWSGGG